MIAEMQVKDETEIIAIIELMGSEIARRKTVKKRCGIRQKRCGF
jgi:hypothetical protein